MNRWLSDDSDDCPRIRNQPLKNHTYMMTIQKQRSEHLFQSLEQKRLDRSFTIRLPRFMDIGKYITCNYFYETAARFSSDERRRSFYKSLRIG